MTQPFEVALKELGFIRQSNDPELPCDWRLVLPHGHGVELFVEDDGMAGLIRNRIHKGILSNEYVYCYIKELKDVTDLKRLVAAMV